MGTRTERKKIELGDTLKIADVQKGYLDQITETLLANWALAYSDSDRKLAEDIYNVHQLLEFLNEKPTNRRNIPLYVIVEVERLVDALDRKGCTYLRITTV